MKKPPLPKNERERLRTLKGLEVLDTPPDPVLDDLAQMAAHLCDTPIALVSLVDENRQWFKARVGLATPETPRDISFCGHVVHSGSSLVIGDALEDERFADNPLVTGAPDVRFYAGAPLRTREGHVLGTLCAIDARARDITEEQIAQLESLARIATALLESYRTEASQRQAVAKSRYLAQIVESTDDAVIGLDRDMRVVSWNRGAESILGHRPEDAVDRDFQDLVRSTCRSEVGLRLDAAVAGLPSERHVTRFFRKDGSEIDVAMKASPIRGDSAAIVGVSVHLRDISQRLVDERARRDAEEERRRFFDLTLDMLCIAGFDGMFKLLSPSWERVLGFSSAELMSRPFVEFIHEDDREVTLQEAGRLSQGVETVHFENRYRTKDGDYRWLLWAASPDTERRVIYAAARDITERKRAEQMKNEFISTVSHELRTPLTSIRGALGLLRGGAAGGLPAAAQPLVDIAEKNCTRLGRLIDDILDIEKIEAGQMSFAREPVSLNELVEESVSQNAAFAEQFDVTLQGAADAQVDVLGDRDRLRQVLDNLISNAVKNSPAGERVDVSLQVQGARARLSVRDRGGGIPEPFHPRVFEKFTQADGSTTRAQPGTGLGLAITKALVEEHGGRIEFASDPERGTTFYVDLPVLEAEEDPATP